MSSQSSTLFTVGTLLRHAADAGSHVRVLVQGQWVAGVPVGADGMGVVLDAPEGQVLVRLDQVSAVSFDRAHIDAMRAQDVEGEDDGRDDGRDDGLAEGPPDERPDQSPGAGPTSVGGWVSGRRVHEASHVRRRALGSVPRD